MIKTEPLDAASQPAAATSTWKNTPTQTIDVGGTSFAYRELGPRGGTPLVFLHHFTAVLDDWDPRVIDGIAAQQARHYLRQPWHRRHRRQGPAHDRRDGGRRGSVHPRARSRECRSDRLLDRGRRRTRGHARESRARTPADPGRDGRARWRRPDEDAADRRRRVPQGGADSPDPRHFLFFNRNPAGKRAATEYIARLQERTTDRDKAISHQARIAQLKAIREAGLGDPRDLNQITQPTFVANGDNDVMVASSQSHELAERIPNAKLTIYPDSGHGGIFQYHEQFVPAVLEFLES